MGEGSCEIGSIVKAIRIIGTAANFGSAILGGDSKFRKRRGQTELPCAAPRLSGWTSSRVGSICRDRGTPRKFESRGSLYGANLTCHDLPEKRWHGGQKRFIFPVGRKASKLWPMPSTRASCSRWVPAGFPASGWCRERGPAPMPGSAHKCCPNDLIQSIPPGESPTKITASKSVSPRQSRAR